MRGTKLTFSRLAPLLLALLVWAGAGRAVAADKNKCGCYKNGAGVCFCDKKAKCGCPGDCEPKGCEEAREKQLQKEIQAETKKAADADKRHAVSPGKEATKSAAREKTSGDEGKASGRGSMKAASATESEPAPPSAPAKKLTPAQVKQLVKLLDQYFAENPDARSRNVEELRNELSQTR
jgi:hypothetical protein